MALAMEPFAVKCCDAASFLAAMLKRHLLASRPADARS